MAKTKRELIFLSCLTSAAAAILSLISLGTQEWIVSSGRFVDVEGDNQPSRVSYGLFSGVLEQRLGGQSTAYEITMTCLVDKNVCAMLCGFTSDNRESELKRLHNGEDVKFDQSCSHVEKSLKQAFKDMGVYSEEPNNKSNRTFINAGCYLSTLIFLIISATLGIFSAALSVWNTGSNPAQHLLNVFGLYIYNAAAAAFLLLPIIIWGAEYTAKLIDNVCILYTITGQMQTKGFATLGYSYWINIASLFLYFLSACVLWLRQFLIEREPKKEIEEIENINDNLMLY